MDSEPSHLRWGALGCARESFPFAGDLGYISLMENDLWVSVAFGVLWRFGVAQE